MTKFNAFLIVFFCYLSLYSQPANTNILEYKSFEDGKTLFVKSNNDNINEYLEKILEEHWTINSYEMISASEIAEQHEEGIFHVDFFTYDFSRDGVAMSYSIIKLLLFKNLEVQKDGTKSPIGTLVAIEVSEYSQAELLSSILLLQSQIKYVKELNINKQLPFKELLGKISQSRKESIKKKTLYLQDDLLYSSTDNEIKIKEFYKHPFEIKSKEEIENAIIDQSSNIAYAKFIRYGSLHFLIIIDAENGNLLYGRVSTGFIQNKIVPRFLNDLNK